MEGPNTTMRNYRCVSERPFAALMFFAWSLTLAYGQAVQNSDAMNSLIAAGDATYAIRGQADIFAHAGRPPSIELVDIALKQNGEAITGDVPQLRIGKTLQIAMRIKRVGVVSTGAQLRIIIRGPGFGPAPSFLQLYPLDAANTEIGCVAEWAVALNLPTRTFVGPGVMTISEVRGDEPANQWAVLYTMPVYAPAASWPSQTGDAVYAAQFGKGIVRLRQSFRLAPGASLSLPIPSVGDRGVVGVGIVSCYVHDLGIAQGTPICRCELVNSEGAVISTATLEYGISTALDSTGDAGGDAPKSKSIPVAFTETAGPANARRERNFYAGRLSLSGDATASIVRFTYLRDAGALDVDDVALLPNVE